MYDMILNYLYDFILSIYSMGKNYSKVEYFLKPILFIIIYLLLD
jgi:hypothetical protein